MRPHSAPIPFPLLPGLSLSSLPNPRHLSSLMALSFFSLVFLFPWCFSCCEILWSFWVFSSAYFPGFLRVRKVRKIPGVFEVFLGIFEKTKEKKDRGETEFPVPVLGRNCALSMRFPDRTPVLDKNRAPIGPEILSSTGAGAWRRVPMAFPDSSSVLINFSLRFKKDSVHSASHCFGKFPTQSFPLQYQGRGDFQTRNAWGGFED